MIDGRPGSLLKTLTWTLALVSDRLRGGAKPKSTVILPASVFLFALSSTMTLSWPPDPTSILPVIEVLDMVFLWSFFIVTSWSAAGCVTLAETGGKHKGDVQERRISVSERFGE
eukprot:CAMPEP_0118638522 /NCGR_PEP_ID=MMETSP0785-20121206/3734_1 /TAXON_ID=91992 /ORGANISM="Bolidomonas pacifica, Strain CCMP 1866" /LENGTH=113 /DNA_ID=CAMNT_0006529787 /DNA_START=241 /DNA_END=582 /DNA_ORIENTATION=+